MPVQDESRAVIRPHTLTRSVAVAATLMIGLHLWGRGTVFADPSRSCELNVSDWGRGGGKLKVGWCQKR